MSGKMKLPRIRQLRLYVVTIVVTFAFCVLILQSSIGDVNKEDLLADAHNFFLPSEVQKPKGHHIHTRSAEENDRNVAYFNQGEGIDPQNGQPDIGIENRGRLPLENPPEDQGQSENQGDNGDVKRPEVQPDSRVKGELAGIKLAQKEEAPKVPDNPAQSAKQADKDNGAIRKPKLPNAKPQVIQQKQLGKPIIRERDLVQNKDQLPAGERGLNNKQSKAKVGKGGANAKKPGQQKKNPQANGGDQNKQNNNVKNNVNEVSDNKANKNNANSNNTKIQGVGKAASQQSGKNFQNGTQTGKKPNKPGAPKANDQAISSKLLKKPIKNQWDTLKQQVQQQEAHIQDYNRRKMGKLDDLPDCELDWKCEAETNISYKVDISNTTFNKVYQENPDLLIGGAWRPLDCKPRWKIALIIPVRDREEHLRTFLRNMIPFLKSQKAQFSIFAIEHVGAEIFNKAQTMDAGFVESQKLGDFDCFIFHDVDMLPVNLCNVYRCEAEGVRHLGISRDLEEPHAEYWACIGGSSAFTTEQFHQINGFTTVMFGWGGEDDDGFFRIWAEDMELFRYEPIVGNYVSLPHDKHNKKHFPKVFRGQETSTHWKYRKYDGLNSLNYQVVEISQNPVLTRIKIQIAGPRLAKELRPYLIYKQKQFQEQLCADNMCIPT